MSEEQLWREIQKLQRRVAALERMRYAKYRGAQAADFTTTTLPHEGDYGYQTTDNELQMNCDGTILKTTMTAL